MELTHLNAVLVPLNNEGDVWATTSGITKAISHEQQFNPESIQALAAFFGGGGKYIGEPVELSGLTSFDCDGGYWACTRELSRSGRSEAVLPLPSRLKASVRGAKGEIFPPTAIGGTPGVRGTMPGPRGIEPGVIGIILGDLMISSSNSFSMRRSSLCSRIASRSSGVMKQEWILKPRITT